ncbi:CDP-alcohol phosphatidyltransferase family protein [Arenimonas composti]|uniref:CDP-diacylglycerol--glycerol-3-phosphate 3-phosphatidyltransferase n=1 Tax=Arenimonas composti TR7-09 = DSM 18010 TaxID=1121013 RepID=A0A091BKZ8_9GAMM|nr:CDP-alcohol phosphatidyltransferase family protein [Arenimonas composti]KFN51454.1 hypothetical protein P873_02660 [Arenimonas composti TR7-09 = DSM 18010]
MNLRHLPNAITGLRLAMAPVLPWLMLQGHWRAAFWLAVAAALSDLADGWLARRHGWQSRLGGALDPIADKLLAAAAFLGLWWALKLPGWVPALVLGRDLVIVAGAAAWWRLRRGFEAAPSWLGKASTLLQLALVLFCLGDAAGLWGLDRGEYLAVMRQLLVGVALVTLLSGLDYVFRYGAKAWQASGKRPR